MLSLLHSGIRLSLGGAIGTFLLYSIFFYSYFSTFFLFFSCFCWEFLYILLYHFFVLLFFFFSSLSESCVTGRCNCNCSCTAAEVVAAQSPPWTSTCCYFTRTQAILMWQMFDLFASFLISHIYFFLRFFVFWAAFCLSFASSFFFLVARNFCRCIFIGCICSSRVCTRVCMCVCVSVK